MNLHRPSLLSMSLAAALMLTTFTALPALAQDGTPLEEGTVSGTLETSDPTLPEDGSKYDLYTMNVTEGTTYVISLKSREFDAFLLVFDENDNLLDLNDDAEGEGLEANDARIEFTPQRDMAIQVYANSVFPDESGAYQLTVATRAN